MKTLTIAGAKQTFLTFEAEELSYAPDTQQAANAAQEFIIEAHGQVTFQETIAVEEMLFGNFPLWMSSALIVSMMSLREAARTALGNASLP